MSDSFSQETKMDLCAQPLKGAAARLAFLYGFFLCAEQFSRSRIVLETENEAVQQLVGKIYAQLLHEKLPLFHAGCCELNAPEQSESIAKLFDLFRYRSEQSPLTVNHELFFEEPCRAAFVRGIFLSCGTVTEPENDYHLELLTRDAGLTAELCAVLESFGLPPKQLRRSSRHAESLYFKDSSAMEDFLNFIGAQKAAFRLMDVKILKDIRNNANRHANCDAANIDKTVIASQKQLQAIMSIIDSGHTEDLPEELRETFDLRAAYPDATLAELVTLHTGKISRSGVCHRLKKILAFAEQCMHSDSLCTGEDSDDQPPERNVGK